MTMMKMVNQSGNDVNSDEEDDDDDSDDNGEEEEEKNASGKITPTLQMTNHLERGDRVRLQYLTYGSHLRHCLRL